MEIEPRAATEAFGHPEILENILSFVTVKTLFNAQRVSQTFKQLIKSSKPLQRKMFLLDDNAKEIEDLQQYMANPLVFENVFPFSCFDTLWHVRLVADGEPYLRLHFDICDLELATEARDFQTTSWRQASLLSVPYRSWYEIKSGNTSCHWPLRSGATLGDLAHILHCELRWEAKRGKGVHKRRGPEETSS